MGLAYASQPAYYGLASPACQALHRFCQAVPDPQPPSISVLPLIRDNAPILIHFGP